jgi:hypothetical protein
MTMYLRRLWMILGGLLLAALAPVAAQAQTCVGLSGLPFVMTGTLDPFSSGSSGQLGPQTFTLVATRPDSKTNEDDFVFVPNSTSQGFLSLTGNGSNDPIQYAASSGSIGVLESPSWVAANLTTGSPQFEILAKYTGQNLNSQNMLITVTIPSGAVTQVTYPTTTISFDMAYDCKTTGGGGKTDTVGQINAALTINFNVLSALKASFAGSALDFGDITNLTLSQATARTVGGSGVSNINVQSSGPYDVSVQSAHGFVMTQFNAALGSTAANQRVGYTLNYLNFSGLTGTAAVPGPTTAQGPKLCNAANISGVQEPISATLAEATGPTGAKLGGSYQDTVTITFQPRNLTSGSQSCP